jgi:F-type H+-transporting ATPase subunit gamma
MAGESMRDIKARIRSVESTMQITKALELVASSRLRGARERADAVRPYFTAMQEAMRGALSSAVKSKYTQSSAGGKTCYIVIAGDRGLAGGYNNNVYKKLFETYSDGDVILPIGKKAVEYFRYHSMNTMSEDYIKAAGVTNSDCMEIAKKVAAEFSEGAFSSVYIIYTEFRSVLSHVPVLLPVLPLRAEGQEETQGAKMLMLYEPSPETVLARIVPQYIAALLSGALAQSITSELAARRIAMEAASGNASEIIDSLNLKYNRARQASITQELTEIMSAADAQQ